MQDIISGGKDLEQFSKLRRKQEVHMVAEQKPYCLTYSAWACGLEAQIYLCNLLKTRAAQVSSLGRSGLGKTGCEFFILVSLPWEAVSPLGS